VVHGTKLDVTSELSQKVEVNAIDSVALVVKRCLQVEMLHAEM